MSSNEYSVESDPYLSHKTKTVLLEARRLNGGQETAADRFLRETAYTRALAGSQGVNIGRVLSVICLAAAVVVVVEAAVLIFVLQ